MTPALSSPRESSPPESVLQQLRIPFVRRVALVSSARSEDAFMIDIGLAGAFVERADSLPIDELLEIRFPWPGSEIPFSARCRVAWWHPEGGALSSKSLPPGAGLQFLEMSGGRPRAAARAARRLLPAEPPRAALPPPLARSRAPGRRPDVRLRPVPRVRFVLVRPETSANVGACARVARNTGAAGLDLVAPGDWRTVDCWRTAWGAHELLEEARVFGDLGSALAGATMAVAFTGRRPDGPPVADVRDVAGAIAGLGRDDTAALVFGPEATGLTNDEIARCGRRATIPAHPAQPSFNLSHAVAIAAYEVFRASRRGATPPGPGPRTTRRRACSRSCGRGSSPSRPCRGSTPTATSPTGGRSSSARTSPRRS